MFVTLHSCFKNMADSQHYYPKVYSSSNLSSPTTSNYLYRSYFKGIILSGMHVLLLFAILVYLYFAMIYNTSLKGHTEGRNFKDFTI